MDQNENKTYKVIFLGDTGVGKTSIINRFFNKNSFVEPTVGVFSSMLNVSYNGENYNLQIFDTAGQERFQSLAPCYVRDSAIAIIVFSINSKSSFQHLENWDKIFSSYASHSAHKILVGNKVDLSETRFVQQSEAYQYQQELNYSTYIETSATMDINIRDLLQQCAIEISQIENESTLQTLNLQSSTQTQNDCC